jgi:hypothetical protein
MNKYLLSFIILFLLNNFSSAQNYKQVQIQLNDISDIEDLYMAGFDFDHPYFTKDKSVIVFVDEDDYNKLVHSNYSFNVLIDDWQEYYENLPQLSDQEKQKALLKTKTGFNVSGFGYGSMGGFYTLDEVLTELDSMKLLFPDLITSKVSIGSSVQSRPIYMVKISNNPNVNEEEPEILYTALHHAREPEGMMLLIYYMYYLLENYGIDPEVTYLVDNREMYFIPVVNPDGYEYNHQTNPNGGGMWRKNRKNNGGSYGVDLNRNYGPYVYWNASNGGSSTDPYSDTYRGTAPFSEPETAAIKDFIGTKNLKNTLNYHTYGNLLIYPYGALEHETMDSLTFREFAGDMTVYNGYVYGTDQQTVGYSTRGNSDDYFYDGDTLLNNGKIFAMTPEAGGYSDGFWPSQSRIIPLAEENVFPNLYYAWVAGGYVGLDNPNFNKQYFNPGDAVEMNSTFKNKGLSDISSVEIQLNSLNSYVTITDGAQNISNIPARGSSGVGSPFTFTVAANAPVEEEIDLEFVISSAGNIMRKDTLSIIIGTPVFVFVDTTNNPDELWTITSNPPNPKWEATTSSYYSLPNSYTDSKNGDYSSNAVVTMTMTNSIDISSFQNPRLVFWSKWNIEDNWDYGQADVSTNGGSSWIPLEGEYTQPGEGSFQPNGEPVYDGIQSSWVREEISLSGYVSSQFKIRFDLNTDGYISRDGWYIDDIGIIVYSIVPVELTSFTAEAGINEVLLKWTTSSELNNSGFEIERAHDTDQLNWVSVGFVEGAGTSTRSTDYIYIDKSPVKGISYYRLKQIDFKGTFRLYDKIKVEYNGITSYELGQNFPNPFNPTTTISYSIPVAGNVNLTIYNLLGSEVVKLIDEQQQAGIHSVHFSTEDLGEKIGSGIYFYTLKSGSFTQTRKMIVLK